MDQTMAGLVGAAIGAGGAVAAQIVSSTFSQRSDSKRFGWEQRQAERRERLARTESFGEKRRELFAEYLALHSSFRTTRLLRYPVRPSEEESGALVDAWIAHVDRSEAIRQEMSLLAPEIETAAENLMKASAQAFGRAFGTDTEAYEVPYMQAYGRAIAACRARMSEILLSLD